MTCRPLPWSLVGFVLLAGGCQAGDDGAGERQAMVAHVRADCAVAYPQAFNVITGVKP